ncbi:TonB-dependent receptor [Dysgonomonas sp. 521]|nr:TonB-dependent receptor [Dysgonomonas sp. 521]NDV94686.1 TonB-dependent receptor [Dysgonomonas sp. 521]
MRSFFFALFFAGMSIQVLAQNVTATGVVTDENNDPLAGVTVKVEGNATTGTMTDIDGNFELSCPSGSVLEFSYIGFNPLKAAAQKDMKIILTENAIALKETVIVGVGYGTMRKSDLTGAIASVGQEDLRKGVITSAEQVLQGKVSGLSVVQSSGDPSQGASIRLRGGTSLSASNSPLVVVDGIPGVDMNTVQPSEIVSIDVLKDASSAAIYGSRGANGVIIITTSRSSSEERRSIQYNGYAAIGYVSKHMDLLSANQWRAYVRENDVKGATDYGGDTDWQKELERTAFTHSHNIYFSNVGKESGYSASITYLNSEGVIKKNSLNRLAGSISAHQYGLNKRLKLEAGITGTTDSWHPIDSRIYERMTNLNPTVPVKDQNGKFTSIDGTNTENPVELNTNRTADDTRHRFLGYGKIELDVIDGLKASANLSYEYNSHQTRFYLPTYAVMEGQAEKGRGQRALADYKNLQLETYLTYDKEFNKIHKLNLMGGYSYLKNMYEGFGAFRRGFDSDMFLYNNLAAGSDYRQGDVYSYKGEATLISFFGRVNYNLLNKYMVTATLRNDGSSRFGANNKWGLFPSVSAAWRISDEAFMEGTSSWLDNLKLRVGYGVTGNQDGLGEYKSLSILSASGSAYYDAATGTWKNSYAPNQNTNADLKWESTEQFNLGLDFTLFNRVTGSLELYSKKTKDLLWTYLVPTPPYLYNQMLANVGSLSNKGVELSLSSNIIKTKDFSWGVNLTASYNKQEITKLSNAEYSTTGFPAGSLHGLRGFSGVYSQYITEGYPLGAFFGPKCLGLDEEGKYIFKTDEQGEVVSEYLGSAQPKVNLGIAMDFSYKDFDLNIAGYGMFGQKVLNATTMSMYDPTRLGGNQNVPDSYITSGITSSPAYSDYWVENGSFFRLQSVTLGYTLPVNLKKTGFDKIRFYVTGENLFVITGYTGIDPEVGINLNRDSNGNITTSPGIDIYDSYPRPRTFSFGVNLSF